MLFYKCNNLIEVSIPDSVTTIGSGAFQGCVKLNKVIYGDIEYSNNKFTVFCGNFYEKKSIANDAFFDTKLNEDNIYCIHPNSNRYKSVKFYDIPI